MTTCPKCGSTAGFSYRMYMIASRIGDWGKNDDEEAEVERYTTPKTVTCMECKKRVKWEIAHGTKLEDK